MQCLQILSLYYQDFLILGMPFEWKGLNARGLFQFDVDTTQNSHQLYLNINRTDGIKHMLGGYTPFIKTTFSTVGSIDSTCVEETENPLTVSPYTVKPVSLLFADI